MFSAKWFFDLDSDLRARGMDSDAQSFDEILENLQTNKIYSPNEFASHCIYVILAGGFSQQTAKKIHTKITNIFLCIYIIVHIFRNTREKVYDKNVF